MSELPNLNVLRSCMPSTGRGLDTVLDMHELSIATLDGKTIFDLGCGQSDLGKELDERGIAATVIGFDFSPKSFTRRDTASKGSQFILANLDALPATDESADIVLATYSLPLWAADSREINDFFSECNRVLKINGLLSVYPMVQKIPDLESAYGRADFYTRGMAIQEARSIIGSGRWFTNFTNHELLSARKLG